MEESYKEVYFGQYCKTCKYEKDDEGDVNSPCYDCLAEPANVYTHKPVKYEEDPKKRRKRNEEFWRGYR